MLPTSLSSSNDVVLYLLGVLMHANNATHGSRGKTLNLEIKQNFSHLNHVENIAPFKKFHQESSCERDSIEAQCARIHLSIQSWCHCHPPRIPSHPNNLHNTPYIQHSVSFSRTKYAPLFRHNTLLLSSRSSPLSSKSILPSQR